MGLACCNGMQSERRFLREPCIEKSTNSFKTEEQTWSYADIPKGIQTTTISNTIDNSVFHVSAIEYERT